MSTKAEDVVKIGPVVSRYLVDYADFCRLVQKNAVVTSTISGVTDWTDLDQICTLYSYDIAIEYFFRSELLYFYLFRNASLPNVGHFANFAQI